ncbi:hypothetical protein [Robertmurraya kyonggiensis]|nr:hypothetical protein [Robertmurraya kyonggiensis]
MDLPLSLAIYNEVVDEEFNLVDGIFKIPFVEYKVSLQEVFSYRDM